MRSALAPLRLPQARRLIGAYAATSFGDWFGEIALSVLVFRETGSVLAVTALWLCARLLPSLPVAFTGAWLARRKPSHLFAAEAVAFGITALVAATGAPLVLVLALSAIDGALALSARSALKSALVTVTRPAGLHAEANSLLNMCFTGSLAAGPPIAGVVIAVLGVPAALLADALSFALTAVVMLSVAPAAAAGAAARRLRLPDVPQLKLMLASEAAVLVMMCAVAPVELVFVVHTLGGTETDFGLIVAAWGIGAVAGSAVLAAAGRARQSLLIGGSLAVTIASYIGMGAAPDVSVVLVWSLIGGIGNGICSSAFMTAVQSQVPDHLQPEVNAFQETVRSVGPGVGFLLGGLLAAAASPRVTYFVAGLGALAVALAATAVWRRANATGRLLTVGH